ncbi:MAG: proton-conducting transporter membrane subunit, partial [Actinomycetes bacterium]
IAVGLGFANPIATAGVLLHVCGHAVAKSLGFYATMPLFGRDPDAAHEPLRGAAATSPAGASALGISLGSLSGLPPSPLFVSELLIMVGGVASGQVIVVTITGILLALAFAGLTRQTLDALFSPSGKEPVGPATVGRWWILSAVFGSLLLALVGLAWFVFTLPGWAQIAGGLS